jgi:3-hydroxy-9,10-secoandrosta-1,3,5(10)-triene-9,17-dione monooxygenase reductase component
MTNSPEIAPADFRRVLGIYPTGVAVVTAIDQAGQPAGLAVGSFTSVSLDPPLVAFMPDKNSSSFPRMRTARSFCVNVLASDQGDLCRRFAVSGGDKFDRLPWTRSPSGAPVLTGVAAWIDCWYHEITEAGDHYIVLGRVHLLGGETDAEPMVFARGSLGTFSNSNPDSHRSADRRGAADDSNRR